jgi:hypothetical protein
VRAESAWNAAWTWIARTGAECAHAPTLLELARAAEVIGDRHRSGAAAQAAVRAAATDGFPRVAAEARSILARATES